MNLQSRLKLAIATVASLWQKVAYQDKSKLGVLLRH